MFARSRILLKITKWIVKRNCTSTSQTTSEPRKKIVYSITEKIEKLRETFAAAEQENYVVPFFKKSLLYAEQIAIKDFNGEYTYLQLYMSAKKLSFQISNICGSGSLQNVAYLSANNAMAAVVQWACWMSGQIVMPLNVTQSQPMLKQLLSDSGAKLILSTPEFSSIGDSLAEKLDLSLVIVDHSFIPTQESIIPRMSRMLLVGPERVMIEGALVDNFYTKTNALLLYTLGTTGRPKGVMLSHKNLDTQMKYLVQAWQISSSDTLLHVLPPDNGLACISALMCPLSVGGRIVMQEYFNSSNAWSTLLSINMPAKERVNMFMSVPAVYTALICDYDKIFLSNSRMVEYIANYCKKNIRLMASGFAPLTEEIYSRWHQITGHSLIHSYGMAETGVVLSNPLNDENDKAPQRSPHTVGQPLPGVKVRLVDENNEILVVCEGHAEQGFWANEPTCEKFDNEAENSNQIIGELQISGANVFEKYFYKAGLSPQETERGIQLLEIWRNKESVKIDESIKLARKELEVIRKKNAEMKLARLNQQMPLIEQLQTTAQTSIVEVQEKQKKQENVEKVEKVEKQEKVEKVEKQEKVEKVEKQEKVEKVEKQEKAEKVEKVVEEKEMVAKQQQLEIKKENIPNAAKDLDENVDVKDYPNVMKMEVINKPLQGLKFESVVKIVRQPESMLKIKTEENKAAGIQLIDGINVVEETKTIEAPEVANPTTEDTAVLTIKAKDINEELDEEDANKFSGNYFRTGDLAIYENGVFRIWGRASDIKTKTTFCEANEVKVDKIITKDK